MDKLIDKIIKTGAPCVAGLDPRLEYIPDHLLTGFNKNPSPDTAARAVLDFNRGLIDALYDIFPAVKPQSAFYELLGPAGVSALKSTIDYAGEKGMYVLVDAKRGDIGSTADAYADAYLGNYKSMEPFGADALTVNPYLGSDGVAPFIKRCDDYGRDIFVLVKTSNPSSGELQNMKLENGKTVYEHMAGLVKEWSGKPEKHGYTNVGAVAGATYPRELAQLRELMPNTFFLVPGYGAQGGGGADVAPGFDKNGLGAIVNSSRGIMCAWRKSGGDYQEAARTEAVRMRDEITAAIR